MKILIIGGTGLLGSEAAMELMKKGNSVTGVALPDKLKAPEGMKVIYGNYLEMTDEELGKLLKGQDVLVFAAGVDERLEGPPSIYEMYNKYNIEPLKRILPIAKANKIKNVVIFGSYFSHFDKIWPELELSKWHPYIRSRREQERVALSFSDEDFSVAILELPYIFGTQKGRKPVWVFLVEMLKGMKPFCFYTAGGTTMVTVHQVAQAIAGAALINKGGNCYPIGYYNLTWKEMLKIMYKTMGENNKKIITIPNWMFDLYAKKILKENKANKIESGLDLTRFSSLQSRRQFILKEEGCTLLGVEEDDIVKAIENSVKQSMEFIEKREEMVGMRGE